MSEVYRTAIAPLLGRALSTLDWEPQSPSHGSFDRTWWCWKFTDFSAPRFQEGAYLLAWLVTSERSPAKLRRKTRLLDGAAAAIRFWTRLQHPDGSFDEAYPFERSLAATAFTGFYVGAAVERLAEQLSARDRDTAYRALERCARWLERNGEYHGVLSNHLAAAAAALQIIGDTLGTDRFRAARDRYLGIIYREQHPREGWLKEYGGADPGYQSHAMFYMAEIHRRTGDRELFGRLEQAAAFLAWFAHPDGTLGGEHASRGTKFTYPAAFEMLAGRIPAAAALAAHARRQIAAGRGVHAGAMDTWNLFPMLNNLLFAAEAAGPLDNAPQLPWQQDGAQAIFPDAGLAVASHGGRVLAVGGRSGGTIKLWSTDGALIYEDCGYAYEENGRWLISQGASEWQIDATSVALEINVTAGFHRISAVRFSPWRFTGFRLFTLTIGRFPTVARRLKDFLVYVLIRKSARHSGRLRRRIRFTQAAALTIDDEIDNLPGRPQPLDRHVPYHMGSARYADEADALGAEIPCPEPQAAAEGGFHRTVRFVP